MSAGNKTRFTVFGARRFPATRFSQPRQVVTDPTSRRVPGAIPLHGPSTCGPKREGIMGTESQPIAAGPAAWPVLSMNERRVLGVLVEKAKTTPDVYPLSLNSLVTGCNQKSNRDPVLDLTDLDVEEALAAAQKKGLAIKITGGRVERWRHSLYEAWRADKVELAILAELLLRGPQTEGELRGRASRMEPIENLDTLRALLKPLVERRMVVYLSPEGRRGTVVTHGFHAPEELKALPARHQADEAPPVSAATPAAGKPPEPSGVVPTGRPRTADGLAELEARLGAAETEIAGLRQLVAGLQATVADLGTQVQNLKQTLAPNGFLGSDG
jgi:uncharacterized protein YceH (UPF0502 family)